MVKSTPPNSQSSQRKNSGKKGIHGDWLEQFAALMCILGVSALKIRLIN